MFCPECGRQLPDGAKFCSGCGKKLIDEPVENFEQEQDEDFDDLKFIPEIPDDDVIEPKKKGKLKIIIGIVIAALVVIVAAAIGVKMLFFNSSSGNAYVYLSDGKYELITNIDKDQTIEIASSDSDSTMDNLLAFSPDGKYLYYYTGYDSDSGAGSLCRAEYGKLKENSSKNDKYIETIDTNVLYGFRFLSDGSLTYKNSDGTLCYFNGKESVQIAGNVSYYYTDASDKIVYVTSDDSESDTLYGVTLSEIDNKIELASDIAYVYSADDFENILYTKYEDDGSKSINVVGFEKEAEKLAENFGNLIFDEGKTYFTVESGTTLNLYDYVEDTYAESDAGATEPKEEDYGTPVYSYSMVEYSSGMSESDFDELYTSCTKPLYWFGASASNATSMKDALDINWNDDNVDAILAATKSFIDKYSGSADENGYILVTDEVKAALKEIVKKCARDTEESEWLLFCYNKYQSSLDVDYDAYNAACDEWNQVKSRTSMRESLQNKENDYAIKTLYCFENGTLTAVNETVLNVTSYTGAVAFNTTDMITEKVNLEDVSTIANVQSMFDFKKDAENYIILNDGSSVRMSSGAAEAYAEAYNNGYTALYFTNEEVYMNDSNGALSIASIRDGAVGDFTIVSDNAKILDIDGSTLYYAGESYQNNDVTYCNLYSCNNGPSSCIAKDVILCNINLYSDGKIFAYTDCSDGSGYELSMIDSDGEAAVIDDNVTRYIRVDESTLLYISDGDLYLYDGEENKMVRSGADQLWSQNSLESENTFGNDMFD